LFPCRIIPPRPRISGAWNVHGDHVAIDTARHARQIFRDASPRPNSGRRRVLAIVESCEETLTRAEHCYIVAISAAQDRMDTESDKVSNGLFTKYSARCGTTTLYHYGPVKRVSSAQGPAGTYKTKVGIYILFHTLSGGFLGIENAEDILKYLALIIPAELLKATGKVVLVACDGAKAGEAATINGVTLDSVPPGKERSVLLNVVMAFNTRGIDPKIAGWEKYISALPHINAGSSLYETTSGGKKVPEGSFAASVGKKFARDRKFGFIDNDYRLSHKRVYYIKDGKIHVDGLTGWSDKD
jgi:hypothetical protein